MFLHRLTHPKLRAERNTSSNIELKLSPTPLSVPEVTEAEKRIVNQKNLVLINWRATSQRWNFVNVFGRNWENLERQTDNFSVEWPARLMPSHIHLLRRNPSFFLDVFEESDKFKARWNIFIFSETNFGADGRKSTCRRSRCDRNGYVRSLTSELMNWFLGWQTGTCLERVKG